MYRKFLPALLLSLGGTASFAQIPSLTAANINPVINDSFISIVCDTNFVSPGSAGADIIWTFTSLFPSTVISPYWDTGFTAAFLNTDPGYGALFGLATYFGSSTAFMSSTYAIATPTGMGTT